MKKSILSLALLVLITGCETTAPTTKTTRATSTTRTVKKTFKDVQVFQMGSTPSQKYTVVGTLKDDAGEDEEDEITVEFQKKAARMGGDAIIYVDKKSSGMEVVPFGFGKIKNTFLYKVSVVKFE